MAPGQLSTPNAFMATTRARALPVNPARTESGSVAGYRGFFWVLCLFGGSLFTSFWGVLFTVCTGSLFFSNRSFLVAFSPISLVLVFVLKGKKDPLGTYVLYLAAQASHFLIVHPSSHWEALSSHCVCFFIKREGVALLKYCTLSIMPYATELVNSSQWHTFLKALLFLFCSVNFKSNNRGGKRSTKVCKHSCCLCNVDLLIKTFSFTYHNKMLPFLFSKSGFLSIVFANLSTTMRLL